MNAQCQKHHAVPFGGCTRDTNSRRRRRPVKTNVNYYNCYNANVCCCDISASLASKQQTTNTIAKPSDDATNAFKIYEKACNKRVHYYKFDEWENNPHLYVNYSFYFEDEYIPETTLYKSNCILAPARCWYESLLYKPEETINQY